MASIPAEHDVQLFRSAVDLMPSSGIDQMMKDFDFGNSFRCYPELESENKTLRARVREFCSSVALLTAPMRHRPDGWQSVNPYRRDWNDALREEARQLNESASEVWTAHQSFIKKGRERGIALEP